MEELSAPMSAHRPTVLLVDDEESILNSLRRLLRGQPYDVLLATSGAQALEILAQQPVNLVMSDARMPSMDGGFVTGACPRALSGDRADHAHRLC